MAVKESDKAHDRSPKNHPRRIGSAGLINVAYDFISMHGLDRLTFRHIANQANCSLGTLTYHFSSRDDLISAVLSDKILPAMQQGALLPHHSDPAIAFLEAIKNGLPYNETTKGYWRVRLELMGFAAQNPIFRTRFRHAESARIIYLEKLFSRLKSLGKMSKDTDVSKRATQTIQFETGAALAMLTAKDIDRVATGDAFMDWLKSILDLD
jgi:AcrR family transcriptional regulator